MITGHPLEKIINGPAHHTLHHIYFTVNYGQVRWLPSLMYILFLLLIFAMSSQYFTWADRTGNSYRQPESYLDPLLEVEKLDKTKAE
jgi:Delta7-sterol 5-desaturase